MRIKKVSKAKPLLLHLRCIASPLYFFFLIHEIAPQKCGGPGNGSTPHASHHVHQRCNSPTPHLHLLCIKEVKRCEVQPWYTLFCPHPCTPIPLHRRCISSIHPLCNAIHLLTISFPCEMVRRFCFAST